MRLWIRKNNKICVDIRRIFKNQDTELYVLVHRLRKKIEDNCNEPRFLIKVCGQGYLLKADNLNAYVSNNSNRF